MWLCASLLCLWPSGIFCPVCKWVRKYWTRLLFSLSATVTIACLFIPKLYIIVLHPEKNVRQSMMNHSKYQSTHHQSIKANGPASLNGGGPTSLSQKCNGMYYVQMYVHWFWKSHFVPNLHCTCNCIFKNERKEKETKQISRIRHLGWLSNTLSSMAEIVKEFR